MNMRVPYLQEISIERDAELLFGEFMLGRQVRMEPPIQIEDILEKHLGLRIEFDDLHARYGLPRPKDINEPEVLGAIHFEDRRIVVDESLDPEEHPGMEGRYRYTLAHEGGGHWRLHRHLFSRDPLQSSLFERPEPSVLCRSSKRNEPVEWQAEFYASCLLMPKAMVLAAWRARFPDGNPRRLSRKPRLGRPDNLSPMLQQVFDRGDRQRDEEAIREFVRPFARQFQVSITAMRIRLEKLGLLLRDEPRQRQLAVGL